MMAGFLIDGMSNVCYGPKRGIGPRSKGNSHEGICTPRHHLGSGVGTADQERDDRHRGAAHSGPGDLGCAHGRPVAARSDGDASPEHPC